MNHRWALIYCTLLSFSLFASSNNYNLTITKVLPASFNGFFVSYQNITPPPKPGEHLVVPFSKEKFCRAEIEKVQQNLILAKSINCPADLLKEGQRIIIRRPRTAQKKATPKAIAQVPKRKHSLGPIFITSTNLDNSTVIANAPEASIVDRGSLFSATSTMGASCTLKVIDIESTSITLDASNCPFERDLIEGQRLEPHKN